LSAQFSEHCKGKNNKFFIEPVEVVYEGTDEKIKEPTWEIHEFEVEIEYICRLLGITLTVD